MRRSQDRRSCNKEKPSNVRILSVDIPKLDGLPAAKFDILKSRWLPTVGFPTNYGSSSAITIRLRRGRPRSVWADAVRDEKHGRQPLWLLDVSYNFGPRRRRLHPSRAGRARPGLNHLARDPP